MTFACASFKFPSCWKFSWSKEKRFRLNSNWAFDVWLFSYSHLQEWRLRIFFFSFQRAQNLLILGYRWNVRTLTSSFRGHRSLEVLHWAVLCPFLWYVRLHRKSLSALRGTWSCPCRPSPGNIWCPLESKVAFTTAHQLSSLFLGLQVEDID